VFFAARDLHPDVRQALERVDAAVRDLVDHALGVVADRIERAGDRPVALADLHGLDLFADDLVEQRRLRQRARDRGRFLGFEVRDPVDQRDDRCGLRLLFDESQVAQDAEGLVEMLEGACGCGHGRIGSSGANARARGYGVCHWWPVAARICRRAADRCDAHCEPEAAARQAGCRVRPPLPDEAGVVATGGSSTPSRCSRSGPLPS
jgi:hypothetical protein